MSTNRLETHGLNAARLAPSAHNTQPWRFRLQNDFVQVGWDPRRQLPAGDPQSRYLLTGLGAAVESLTLGAAQKGLNGEVSFGISFQAREVASVRFSPGKTSSTELKLAQAIPYRQTTRLPFRTDTIPNDALNAIRQAGNINGCNLVIITEQPGIRRLASTLVEGTVRNFEDSDVYKEFFAWVRLSRNDSRYQQDGLTLNCLALSRLPRMLAPWIMPPDRMSLLTAVRFHRLIAKTQGDLARRSPAICLLVAASHSFRDLFLGGQTMMRVWLAATDLGLRVHPITAMMDHEDTRIILASISGAPPDSSMVVCFRLGYGPLAPRAPKLPLEELITIEESAGQGSSAGKTSLR